MKEEKNAFSSISVRTFLGAIAVIFALMVLTYVLALTVPGGEYARVPDANGNMVIDTAAEFQLVQGGIPFWKWILSPVLVLGASGNATLIAVIVFLLVIGGIFNSLNQCGVMTYMLDKITFLFGEKRYKLMAVVLFFFMAMGSLVGSFEEVVPLVPIVVALSVSLGWDALTGVAMSLLAAGCGFAAGVCNPFSVGVAQELAGLPMFSGIWLRLVSFILIYALLLCFVRRHAGKVEKPVAGTAAGKGFCTEAQKDRALRRFVIILAVGMAVVLSSGVLTFLQDYTLIIVALTFLIAGLTGTLSAGISIRELGATFRSGMVSILPAVLMILMASSIKYTLEEARILDTILHGAVTVAQGLPQWVTVLFIYLLVLVMNFFVASGSAKAFMLIPIIVPLAQVLGISSQLCVMAYAFGDGFSNVFYVTNAALLISLGLVNVSYVDWVRWSWKFQLLNLLLTSALLLLGLAVGY